MKKLIFFATALLLTSPAWSDVFDQIKLARQFDLADAYYQAGARFIELGQKDRGTEFQDAALKIFPGYKPGVKPANLSETSQTSTPTTDKIPANLAPVNDLTGIPERPLVRERNINGAKIVRLQFSKLVRGFISEDPTTVETVLGKTLKGPGFEAGLTVAEVEAGMKAFFAASDTTRLSPSQMYKLDSLDVTAVPQTTDDWILTIQTAGDEVADQLAKVLPFWQPTQKFYFAREGASWKLIGISN